MKNVLLITYHYPPSAAVGSIRPSKFARFLPRFDWQPFVLTASQEMNRTENSQNETAHVLRVSEWPHPLKIFASYKLQRAKRLGQEEELRTSWQAPFALGLPAGQERGVRGHKDVLLSLLKLPDQETGWIPPAITHGMRVVRHNKIDRIWTTGPPFSCHLVGLMLKRLMGVRWLADFRDPWSVKYKLTTNRNPKAEVVESWLIRTVMKQADVVVSVTPHMTEEARKEHSALDPSKFVTITNGYDLADFSGLPAPVPSNGPTIFTYLGTFYYGRTPLPFLRALRKLLDEGAIKPCEIRVRFSGDVVSAEGRSVSKLIHELGLQDIVSLNPRVPRTEALRQTIESDVFLVLDERHPTLIPFKLYDALPTSAVIFNVGSKGAVSEVLAKTGRGVAVNFLDTKEIEQGILECIKKSRSVKKNVKPSEDPTICEYDFQYLTGQLARLLDGLR